MRASYRACIYFATLVTLLVALPASADTSLSPGASAVVAEVIDGDTVILDRAVDGARQVRLVGLQAPKLPLGRTGFPTWPLAEKSRAAIAKLVLGQTVTLHYGGARIDRHGRHLAHLFDQTGAWIQGEMLRLGMARVYSFPDNRSRIDDMLAIEATSRSARRGIWDHPFYAVRTVETVGRHVDTFQVVEGRVLDAARIGGRTYLNFGPDWHTDFTVTIESRSTRLFRTADINPLSFKGQVIRARGWLRDYNGPMIEATHPEQIEVSPEP
jgi:micrococcal nuclease